MHTIDEKTDRRRQLLPVREYFRHSSAYWGERADWLVAYDKHRDADALSRSNFRQFLQALGGNGSEGSKGSEDVSPVVAIEEARHWAVGWIQRIVIHPEAAKEIAIAETLLEKLEGYPVLSDDDFSAEEDEEAQTVWSNCFSVSERIEYIREHRGQFNFRGFADLLGCVRGHYFAGYASELLY